MDVEECMIEEEEKEWIEVKVHPVNVTLVCRAVVDSSSSDVLSGIWMRGV